MKNLVAIISLVFLVACGGAEEKSIETLIQEGNLEAIQAKKEELTATLREQQAQIHQIDTYMASKDSTKKLPLVSLYKIESQSFSHFVELQGSVETDQNIVVYPEFSGILQSFKVSMGEKVTKLGMSPKKIKKAGQECEDKGGVLLEIMAWKTVTLYGICVDKSALIQLTLDQ